MHVQSLFFEEAHFSQINRFVVNVTSSKVWSESKLLPALLLFISTFWFATFIKQCNNDNSDWAFAESNFFLRYTTELRRECTVTSLAWSFPLFEEASVFLTSDRHLPARVALSGRQAPKRVVLVFSSRRLGFRLNNLLCPLLMTLFLWSRYWWKRGTYPEASMTAYNVTQNIICQTGEAGGDTT